MTKDEALKLALEALEDLGMKHFESTGEVLYKETFTAIKEALAQPAVTESHKQEPVAWAKFSAKGNIVDLLNEPDDGYTPLYTTPPQRTWVGLTLDERIELAKDVDWPVGAYCEYAEKIEAKLKEKNA